MSDASIGKLVAASPTFGHRDDETAPSNSQVIRHDLHGNADLISQI